MAKGVGLLLPIAISGQPRQILFLNLANWNSRFNAWLPSGALFGRRGLIKLQ